ncbi:MAG TPA: hypothetical protein VMD04_05765, partial [Candidatus Margulisiibacteriota bacterium]|nr:hypothetical protein [Candidatus Margulisiibacteriota bacterium]
ALDKDILDLIKKYMPEIRKLQIVNGTREAGTQAHDKMVNHCNNIKVEYGNAIFEGGFTQFIQRGIHSWLQR